MNYYKYTTGTAFYNNGEDYVGFFHLSGSTAYSGRILTGDSVTLSYKPTIVAEFFKKRMEYDTTYQNLPTTVPYYSNTFDILNGEGLAEMTSAIDNNNIICYKGLNVANPIVYDFEKNNNIFYGAYKSVDGAVGRRDYTHIEPFTSVTSFEFMEELITGIFFVNSQEEFRYWCSVGETDYIISGNFSAPSTLNVIYINEQHPDYTTTPDFTYKIHNDYDNFRVFIVNNEHIRIYDTSSYEICNKLTLVDQISMEPTITRDHIFGSTHYTIDKFHYRFKDRFHTYNNNNPQYIRFGRNARLGIYTEPNLEVSAEYPYYLDGSSKYYWIYNDRGQRTQPGYDNTLKIYNKTSSTLYQTVTLSQYGVGTLLDLDISPMTDDILILHEKDSRIWLLTIYGMDFTNITNIQLNDVLLGMEWYKVKFSSIDSNQFYVYNKNEYQTRYLTAQPYPAGRLETGELQLLDRYPLSELREKFGKIKLKFNSYYYESNHFNVVLASETTKNTNMYMLLQTVGRLYALKQPISESIYSLIPDNLVRYFEGVKCSESSIGLHVNSVLSNIIKDTLNIMTNARGRFSVGEYEIMVSELTEITFDMENMYINGNEPINVVSLQRILSYISNIQSKLLPI